MYRTASLKLSLKLIQQAEGERMSDGDLAEGPDYPIEALIEQLLATLPVCGYGRRGRGLTGSVDGLLRILSAHSCAQRATVINLVCTAVSLDTAVCCRADSILK